MMVKAKVRIRETISPRYSYDGLLPGRTDERFESVTVFCPDGSTRHAQEERVRTAISGRQLKRLGHERTGLDHVATWEQTIEELVSEEM